MEDVSMSIGEACMIIPVFVLLLLLCFHLMLNTWVGEWLPRTLFIAIVVLIGGIASVVWSLF